MKELSVENQKYLCKYHDVVNVYDLKTTIGISKEEMENLVEQYKRNGLYEQYRKLSEDEYEEIIKQEKKKDKYTKILERYNFDKTKKGYENLKQVMQECSRYKNSTDISLEKIFRKLADKQGIRSYIINNDCKRMLDSTYLDNKKIFEEKGYYKKPTLREFVLQELGIEKLENVCKTKEKASESKETISSQFTVGDIENTFVKVSVKTIMDWSYQKGYLDRMLEENKN